MTQGTCITRNATPTRACQPMRNEKAHYGWDLEKSAQRRKDPFGSLFHSVGIVRYQGCNVAFCCLTNGLLADQRNLQENKNKELLHVGRVKFVKKLFAYVVGK